MGLAYYNGWLGKVRELREAVFKPAVKKGLIPVHKECAGCGYHKGNGGVMPLAPHGEEYGSTPEHYINSCVTLCARCHALLHIRHSYPRVWHDYLGQIATDGWQGIKEFPSLMSCFGYVFQTKQKTAVPEGMEYAKTGMWLDTLSVLPYTHPTKIATIIHGEYGEIPDPSVYSVKEDVIAGLVVGPDGAYFREYRLESGVWQLYSDTPYDL